MGPHAVWILNLDTELRWSGVGEVAVPEPARVAARGVMAPGDVELDEALREGRLDRGAVGRAWCPTLAARDRFAELGVVTEPWPKPSAVRTANHRGTWARHGLVADDSVHFERDEEWSEHLAAAAPGTRLRLKRPYTVAGRGHRRFTVGEANEAAVGWIARTFEMGGLTVEPERDVAAEWSLHGRVSVDGGLVLGQPVRQRLQNGAWVGAEPATDLDVADARLLAARAEQVAETLRTVGYFGPFGVDAMHARGAGGDLRFLPATEVNARYTLSWPTSGLDADRR